MSLLTALGAYPTYRRRQHGRIDAARAAYFMLLEAFPRSLNHRVTQVQRELAHLPGGVQLDSHCLRCRATPPAPAARPNDSSYARDRLAAVAELAEALERQYFD